MITVINNGTCTFNCVRVGQIAEIDEKFLPIYEEYGFEKIENPSDEEKEDKNPSDEETPKGKKQNLKKVV